MKVRADQKRHAKERLEQILLKAINSGDPVEITPAMVEAVRQRLHARAAQRKRAKGLDAALRGVRPRTASRCSRAWKTI